MSHPPGSFKCAVLCWGYMLDLGASTQVAEMAAQFGFSNPGAGRSLANLPQDLPLFVARAGQDQIPHLNQSIDAFIGEALARNLPLTFMNHASGPHAFDLFEDSEASRQVIRSILAFLRFALRESGQGSGSASVEECG